MPTTYAIAWPYPIAMFALYGCTATPVPYYGFHALSVGSLESRADARSPGRGQQHSLRTSRTARPIRGCLLA